MRQTTRLTSSYEEHLLFVHRCFLNYDTVVLKLLVFEGMLVDVEQATGVWAERAAVGASQSTHSLHLFAHPTFDFFQGSRENSQRVLEFFADVAVEVVEVLTALT